MEQHVQGLGDIARRSYEYMNAMSFEIYDDLSESMLTMMANLARSGVPVKIVPQKIGGFICLDRIV